MNFYGHFRVFWSLFFSVAVFGDIIREDDNFGGEFSNNHKGRMLRILMVFNNVPLDTCVVKCIQHIRCKTVNYNFEKEKCELTDVDFNDDEADKLSLDWYNFGTQPKVDGKWGLWRNVTRCTATCAGGRMSQARDCDSPKPQHGGDDCVGKEARTIDCNTHPCPVDGKWGAWTNYTSCTVNCGGGELTQKRLCDSPKPEHGGKDCIGYGGKTISCNTHSCPVPGNWGAWKITSVCNDQCNGGTFIRTRDCIGGDVCAGDNSISLPCSTSSCPVFNRARGKPATQNGLSNGAIASNGNDGTPSTFSCTTYSSSPWWQVDLQADVKIEYFVLRVFVGDKDDVRIRGKTTTGTTFITCKDPVSVKADVATFSSDSNQRFRYIRLEQKVQGYLKINEFEVYVLS